MITMPEPLITDRYRRHPILSVSQTLPGDVDPRFSLEKTWLQHPRNSFTAHRNLAQSPETSVFRLLYKC
jgi:hypothetical protein